MADPTKEEIQDEIRDSAKRYWELRGCPVGQDLDIWLSAERTFWNDVAINKSLSEKFIREFKDNINLNAVVTCQNLSEEFLRELKDRFNLQNWLYISQYQKLSEDFIREFKDKVNWLYISECQYLSENFIREFQDKVDWSYISTNQVLSENFIREFQNKVNWHCISMAQDLSENFIREFQNKVDWTYISKFQKLSESFLKEFHSKISWFEASVHQKLSEELIHEFYFKKDLIPRIILAYQKISIEFAKKFGLVLISSGNWIHATKEEKLKFIKEKTNYQVINDEYILAYKSVRYNGSSVFKPGIIYRSGQVYEASNCDCNLISENSFGLSAWTKEGALSYHGKGKLFLVKIYIDDIGAIVQDSKKIRCFKLQILEEVSKDG